MKYIFILFTLLAYITLTAQTDDKKWDVNHPPGDSSMTVIKTNEGTWMSIDVSPDGENIVEHNTLGKDRINPNKIFDQLNHILS